MLNTNMKTFGQQLESALVRTMIDEGMLDWMHRTPKKPLAMAPKPPMARITMPPKIKKNDSPHYKTNHHYGNGDIEPSQIPVFHGSTKKPSWA